MLEIPVKEEVSTTSLASELQSIKPLTLTSSLPGFEYVRGFGVYSLPFDSGHLLALRVLPENDFAPYITIWHRPLTACGLFSWMDPASILPAPAAMA